MNVRNGVFPAILIKKVVTVISNFILPGQPGRTIISSSHWAAATPKGELLRKARIMGPR